MLQTMKTCPCCCVLRCLTPSCELEQTPPPTHTQNASVRSFGLTERHSTLLDDPGIAPSLIRKNNESNCRPSFVLRFFPSGPPADLNASSKLAGGQSGDSNSACVILLLPLQQPTHPCTPP